MSRCPPAGIQRFFGATPPTFIEWSSRSSAADGCAPRLAGMEHAVWRAAGRIRRGYDFLDEMTKLT
jgi:hypothetical protein